MASVWPMTKCSGPGSCLPQAHDGQETRDASEDAGGFQDSRADKTHGGPLVLPLEHRVQRNGGADAREGQSVAGSPVFVTTGALHCAS
jgi:hypothetical protein